MERIRIAEISLKLVACMGQNLHITGLNAL